MVVKRILTNGYILVANDIGSRYVLMVKCLTLQV